MVEIMSNFHFIRPLWLLMLIPVIIVVIMCFNAQRFPTNWHKVIHPKLINHMLIGKTNKITRWPLFTSLLCWIVACLSLAGPAWNKTTVNAHKSNYPLVIVLDLSPGILAADIPPNRLSRVSYKLQDLLKTRDQGSNALVVYSGSAHAVAPLTDDNNTLINLIQTLSPAVMPTIGNRADIAIELAVKLLEQAGHAEADILLLTHEVSEAQQQKIKSVLSNSNIKLSVIGVGTEYGGPILLSDATYLKDNKNNVKLFKLQEQQLRNLAKENGGKYIKMTVDNKDLNTVLPKPKANNKLNMQERNVDYWQDMGIWLVLLLLPFALFAFRWLCPALLLVLIFPINDSYAVEWQDLWQTKNQQAQKAFNNKDYAKASNLFEDPKWKAQALYAEGNYQQAAMASYKETSAADEFNRANALAKIGDFSNSIIAYDKALELDPTLEDAQFNKSVVKKLLKQQNEQQQKEQQEKEQQQQKQQQAKQSQNEQQQGDKSQQQKQEQAQQQNSQSNNQKTEQQQQSEGSEQQQQDAKSQQAQNSQENSQNSDSADKQQQSATSSENKQSEDNKNQESQGQAQNSEQTEKPEDKSQQQVASGKEDESKQDDSTQKSATAKQSQASADQQKNANNHKQSMTNNKPENSPEQQAVESWLRTIPDNPGGLLKRKFMHQYKQQNGL